MKKVVIIGGGIAGLSAGIYLLKNGFEVEIYEKNNNLGGYLTSWYRKGILIDGCLHWMLGTKEGTPMNKIWKEVGALENVNIYQPKSFFASTYEGRTLHFYNDLDLLEQELYKFSDNDDEEIASFMKALRAIKVMEIPSETAYELIDAKDVKVDLRLLVRTRNYLSITLEEEANKFNSKEIRFALLNSPVNKKFSAFYFLQTIANFAEGNDALPEGGTLKARDRMVNKFVSLGGKVFLNSDVTKIIYKDNNALGIELASKEVVNADYIVPACDVHYVKEVLLDNKFKFEPYDQIDGDKEKYPTYSFIIATYKTKNRFKDDDIHQVYKVKPYKVLDKEYDELSFRHYGYDKEFISKNDEIALQVMVTTYEDDFEKIASLSKEEYKKFKEEIGILLKEKVKEIYSDIELELIDVLTPLTYVHYLNAYKGTFMTYALGPKMNQVIRRYPLEGLDNVILANQWLMMPGGTPVAVVNGKFAAQNICAKENKDYHF